MSSVSPFSISRTFKAPLELVYEVHTKAEHLGKWFGPAGTVVKKFEMNFFVGGVNHYCIEIPGGVEMWGRQTYLEIVPNQKIVHVQSFSNEAGEITHHPMSPTWPAKMHATTTFEVDGDGTKVTVTWLPYEADEVETATFDAARDSMSGGFKGMFDNIETYLASLQ